MRPFAFALSWMVASTLVQAQPSESPDNPVRFITTGWNTPTVQQFARDADDFFMQTLDGCVLNIRADDRKTNPLSKGHDAGDWDSVGFSEAEQALEGLSQTRTESSYLVIRANPGDADWLDDQAWNHVVDHWRMAAKLAKRGNLRGLVFDPEPYELPLEQFNFATQSGAATHSFAEYSLAARKRGQDVMTAVGQEYPDIEIFSYFLMSYLVRSHGQRGPSPIGDNDQRRSDFDWCLEGHAYGLLPSFLSGMLDAASKEVQFIDGCEYGYWLTEPNDFAKLAKDVRVRGRALVDEDVQEKYDKRVAVAFPVFVDIVHLTLIPQWTLSIQDQDRLGIFRRQLTAAANAGDGLVWLYGERGSWWPDPTDTGLWDGKDVYPHWSELLPGSVQVLADVQDQAVPRSLKPIESPIEID